MMYENEKTWKAFKLLSDKRVRNIVCLLCSNAELPVKEIPNHIGVSTSTAYNLINEMYDAALVDRRGTRRDGFIIRLRNFSLPRVTPAFIYEKEKGTPPKTRL